jgi:hypothetical protein
MRSHPPRTCGQPPPSPGGFSPRTAATSTSRWRVADIDPADAGILAAAAAIFSNRRAPDHVRQALEAGAEIAYGHCDDGACTWLALTTTRLAELFSMIPDHDSEVLAATMQRDQEHDIVLASGSEAAYRRYATRANQIWQAGDPLHLWQY